MLQLEALENIAACLAPSARHGPPADRGAGKVAGGPSAARLRLDLFQAVNFARRLAENMAERRVL